MVATNRELSDRVARLERLIEHKDGVLTEVRRYALAVVGASEAYGEVDSAHLWQEIADVADKGMHGPILPRGLTKATLPAPSRLGGE